MKKQVRLGVFETNSSSTHSITICSPEQLEQLRNGTCTDEQLVEKYKDMEECGSLELYVKQCTTPGGEKIVIFGNYGYDG